MAQKTDPTAIPGALRNFDQLRDSAFLRQPVVQALVACSSATMWRRVADRRIPKPQKLFDRDVAKRFSVAPITVRRLITEGKLPAVQLKKAIRLRAEDVEALVRMGYQQVRRQGKQA